MVILREAGRLVGINPTTTNLTPRHGFLKKNDGAIRGWGWNGLEAGLGKYINDKIHFNNLKKITKLIYICGILSNKYNITSSKTK